MCERCKTKHIPSALRVFTYNKISYRLCLRCVQYVEANMQNPSERKGFMKKLRTQIA